MDFRISSHLHEQIVFNALLTALIDESSNLSANRHLSLLHKIIPGKCIKTNPINYLNKEKPLTSAVT